jgi:hypothetical protein
MCSFCTAVKLKLLLKDTVQYDYFNIHFFCLCVVCARMVDAIDDSDSGYAPGKRTACFRIGVLNR